MQNLISLEDCKLISSKKISKTLLVKLKNGFLEVSKSTKLMVGVFTAMAARMNTILITVRRINLFLILVIFSIVG